MTPKQFATIISRGISVWFIYQVVSSLRVIPLFINQLSLLHSVIDNGSYLSTPSHTLRMGMANSVYTTISTTVIAFILNGFLAIAFYNCGPRVLHFLTGNEEETIDSGKF